LQRASTVVTLSKHAQQEILTLFPYLKNRVYAIPLAPSDLLQPIDKEKDLWPKIRSGYKIHSEFILAVGNLQPRKNLIRLVRAFASIRADLNRCQLVIVGKAQWQSSEVYSLVESLGLEEDVIFTGYVPDDDLRLLYNLATVFVYPSLYEGFGLPILEAMACGTPVIASRVASMPEVAGNAAILIDPYQEREIAGAIRRVVTDVSLAESLSRRGLAHAKQFSWARTAAKTRAVYESVMK
jgi:glycosyltransferase involved in cell wall biosynthesis